jgi:hypothetical protein
VIRAALLLCAVLAAGCSSCGRENGAAPSAVATASGADGGGAQATRGQSPDAATRSPDVDALWNRAKEGEPDDLARLANREGASGLVEVGTSEPSRKRIAIAALAYADGLSALPWLADAADGSEEDDARAAVESIDAMAARPRRAIDPEDGAELRMGCDRLLAIAKNTTKKRPLRVGAVRALRMWSDRGCAKAADLPTDLDAH